MRIVQLFRCSVGLRCFLFVVTSVAFLVEHKLPGRFVGSMCVQSNSHRTGHCALNIVFFVDTTIGCCLRLHENMPLAPFRRITSDRRIKAKHDQNVVSSANSLAKVCVAQGLHFEQALQLRHLFCAEVISSCKILATATFKVRR